MRVAEIERSPLLSRFKHLKEIAEPAEAKDMEPVAGSAFRIGIKPTITGCIVLIVIVGIGLAVGQQWATAQRVTNELTRQNARLVMDQIDADLAYYLSPVVGYVRNMVPVLEWAGDDASDPAIAFPVFSASLAALPQVVGAGYIPVNRPAVGVERDEEGDIVMSDHAEAVRAAVATEGVSDVGPQWAKPVFEPDIGAPVVRVWNKVTRNGNTVGIVYAGVSLSGVSRTVSEASDRFNGTAFLLDSQGHLVAHPNLTWSHPDYGLGRTSIKLERSGDIVLQGLMQTARAGDPLDRSPGRMQMVEADLDGRDYVGFIRRTSPAGEDAWTLGIWFAASDILGQRERITASIWIAAVFFGGSFVLAWIAGGLVSGPVRRTAAAVKTLSQMNFGKVDRLPRSVISEVDDLAVAFNSMHSALRLFGTYVPQSLVRRLVGENAEHVMSSERQISIMFTDIVGFTTFSEGKTAADAADFLNEHFQILGECVEKTGGTIDKYIGDALMAFWGAPEEMEDSPVQACYCAMAIADALERDNARRRQAGLPPVYVRIGIHTGPALVGNIGAEGRVNYTVVGDSVNTCQRVENLGREVDVPRNTTTILITDTVAAQLPSSMPFVRIGSFTVKGKGNEVIVYRLVI
jgi:class 3 adenylate cyclase